GLEQQYLQPLKQNIDLIQRSCQRRATLCQRFDHASTQYMRQRAVRFSIKDRINAEDMRQRQAYLDELNVLFKTYQQDAVPDDALLDKLESGIKRFKGVHLSSLLCQAYHQVATQTQSVHAVEQQVCPE